MSRASSLRDLIFMCEASFLRDLIPESRAIPKPAYAGRQARSRA